MSTYKNLEEVLKIINQEHITLKTDEVAYNNKLLKATLEKMIYNMKNLDSMFATIYKEPFYGGSFYDDLKVGKPDEFDLDLLFVLPKICEHHKVGKCGCLNVVPSNKPGFFWFKIKKNFYGPFNKFIKDGYMQTDLVLNWLKGLVTTALNKLNSVDFEFGTPKHHSQSGPAITVRLFGKFGNMDVDLVPSFKFGGEYWPGKPFRENRSRRKRDFFIVPKKAIGVPCGERYWRPSFQDQERELINGKERLKPSLRILKKMRNNLGHSSISSYALKTIVLWDVEASDWNRTLSDIFMKMLQNYKYSLNDQMIKYYWNSGSNLLYGINSDTLKNHYNEISRKIDLIERGSKTDPLIVARVILKDGSDDYKLFKVKWDIQNWEFADITNSHIEIEGAHAGESTIQRESSGLGTTAKIILGLGASVSIGLGFLGALTKNRGNQDK